MSIVCSNYSLAYSSVGFYQISKLFCIPVTLVLETLLDLRQQQLTFNLIFSLIILVTGMSLVVDNELSSNIKGLIWTILGILATSSAQVFFSPLKKELGLDAMQLLFHTSPWLAFCSFVFVPAIEDTNKLIDYTLSYEVVIYVFLSCMIAVAFNTSNYLLLGAVSPLTYTIIGHGKTISIIILGYYFFDSSPSQRMMYGIVFALIGVMIYTYEVNRQSVTNNNNKISNNISNNNSNNIRINDEKEKLNEC